MLQVREICGRRRTRRRGRRRRRTQPEHASRMSPSSEAGPANSLQVGWKSSRRRSQHGKLKRPTTESPARLLSSVLLIALIGFCVSPQKESTVSAAFVRDTRIHPSVQLPKYGLSRGVRFNWLPDERDMRPATSSSGSSESPETVAAFLGVPYAAPPSGPLRFMPPGAARPTAHHQRGPGEAHQCSLLEGDGTRSATTSPNMPPSRSFEEFGHECVQLADWLPMASQAEVGVAATNRQQSGERPRQVESSRRRQEQSEDCLNLNVFVPLKLNKKQLRHSGANQPARPTGKAKSSTVAAPTQRTNEQLAESHAIRASDLSRRHAAASLSVSTRGNTTNNNNNDSNSNGSGSSSSSRADNNNSIRAQGFLPYVDLEDQLPVSGHMRSNHALWDQIGLLHWIKHNVAHFGGDHTNVSLISGDAGAVSMVQLLALSPQAKGLFKRLILVHDEVPNDLSNGLNSNPGEHVARLFDLAQKSRHLHRKLVNELGLVLERNADLAVGLMAGRADGEPQDNLEIDRRVSKFLKWAKLEQLARVEHELAHVLVSQQAAKMRQFDNSDDRQPTNSLPVTTRLIDVIRQPNLNDKLLFPYFAHLIKTNQTLHSTLDADQGDRHAGGFWASLMASLDNHQQGDNSTKALQTIRLEADYCQYMQQIYSQMFAVDRPAGMEEPNSVPSLMGALKRVDPLKLIPRLNDHQQQAMLATDPMLNRLQALPSANEKENKPGRQHLESSHLGRWRQRNRTANALEFYHLSHSHLLQQMITLRLSGGDVEDNTSIGEGRDNNSVNGGQPRRIANEEEDADEEDADHLLTRLQRQQQRSAMLMQQQQLGRDEAAGSARNKRDSLDGQAIALGQQMVEQLGSFDLLIGFFGQPLVEGTAPLETPLNESGLARLMLAGSKTLSSSLVSYLQLADLHHLASIRSTPRHLERMCEFTTGRQSSSSASSASSSQVAANWRQEPKFERPRVGHVLVMDRRSRKQQQRQEDMKRFSSSPLDELNNTNHESSLLFSGDEWFLDKVSQFARTGSFMTNDEPGDVETDSSTRSKPEWFRPFNTLDRKLGWIEPSASNSSFGDKLIVDKLISVHLNLLPYLERLQYVTRARQHGGFKATSKHEHPLEHPLMPPVDLISCLIELDSIANQAKGGPLENASLVRFNEELPCLLNSTNKLRIQLRTGASEDIEPLMRQYFALIEQRQRSKLQAGGQSNSEQSDRQTSAAISAGNQKRVSSMTTRNLVNQSEGIYLDQLSSSASSGNVAEQADNHLDQELNDGRQRLELSHSGPYKTKSNSTNSTSSGSIRNFFAKTYKDAVGQALGVVVGTGLLIFLLNLAIVLIIAIRSRRCLRRSVRDSSDGEAPSKEADVITNGFPTNGPANVATELVGCQHLYNQMHQQVNDTMTRRPQSSAITSFKNAPDQQLSLATPHTALTTSSQRANKSIKFNLSGTHSASPVADVPERRCEAKSMSSINHRGIMKQPPTTSDDDELQAAETVIEKTCAHHQLMNKCTQPSRAHHADQADLHGQIAVSPASLDVFDLIPFDACSGYDAQELTEIMSGGDDYLASGFKLMTGSANVRKCQANRGHHAHHSQQLQRQQQQLNHYMQSLGSSSLTSPFASQSTHSTASMSNNGYVQSMTNRGVQEFSPRKEHLNQHHHHHQQLTLFASANAANFQSPLSSNSPSDAPTPLLFTQSSHDIHNKPIVFTNDQVNALDQPMDPVSTGNQIIGFIYENNSPMQAGQMLGNPDSVFQQGVGNQSLVLVGQGEQSQLQHCKHRFDTTD